MKVDKREMEILDTTGHTKTTWDAANAAEVEQARATFAALTGKGFRAFRVNKSGGEGQQLTTFDADAQAMILVPAIQAG